DLVHALAHTDRGGQMVDMGRARQRLAYRLAVAHVALLTLDLRMQVIRETRVGPVHLFLQGVEYAYPMSAFDEPVRQMRPDEAGASGDEHAAGRGGTRAHSACAPLTLPCSAGLGLLAASISPSSPRA